MPCKQTHSIYALLVKMFVVPYALGVVSIPLGGEKEPIAKQTQPKEAPLWPWLNPLTSTLVMCPPWGWVVAGSHRHVALLTYTLACYTRSMYHPAPIGRRPSLVLFSASRVFGVRCLCAKMPLVMVTIASSLPGLACKNRFYSCIYVY